MRNLFSVLCAAALLLSGCAPAAAQPATLTVLAAASLTEPFTALGQQFESDHPGVTVQFNFAGSQQLAAQLAQGAPADVFAAASAKTMQAAVDAGRIQSAAVQNFASNRLVIITPRANPAGLQSLDQLARPGLKLNLPASEVPAGMYALQVFTNAAADPAFGADFSERVLKNVVSYEQNVKAVVTKVSLGEVDAGIVYASDARSAQEQVAVIEIPAAFNISAVYPAAVVADSPAPQLAADFLTLLQSPAGQAVLASYGFLPAAE